MPSTITASNIITIYKHSPTTPVVPSPISSSCAFDNSTSNLAISCSRSIIPSMVAPSLVMVTSPSELTIILSRPKFGWNCYISSIYDSLPFGPSEERITFATVLAANMCAWNTNKIRNFQGTCYEGDEPTLCASIPANLLLVLWSLSIINGWPYSSKAIAALLILILITSLYLSRVFWCALFRECENGQWKPTTKKSHFQLVPWLWYKHPAGTPSSHSH